MKKNDLYLLLLSLFIGITAGEFFPSLPLVCIAPIMCKIVKKYSLLLSIWIGALVGLFFDLFNYTLPFGSFSIIYTISTLLAHRYQQFFFEDKIASFLMYIQCYALLSSWLAIAVTAAFAKNIKTNILGLLSNVILTIFIHVLYALIWEYSPKYTKKVAIELKTRYKEFRIRHQKQETT